MRGERSRQRAARVGRGARCCLSDRRAGISVAFEPGGHDPVSTRLARRWRGNRQLTEPSGVRRTIFPVRTEPSRKAFALHPLALTEAPRGRVEVVARSERHHSPNVRSQGNRIFVGLNVKRTGRVPEHPRDLLSCNYNVPAPNRVRGAAFGDLSLSSHALLSGYFPKSGMPKSYIHGLGRNRS